MNTKTPEERAEERFDKESGYMDYHRCEGAATIIREQVEPLEAWKESAIKELSKWDKVHEALGKPGKLGESMAEASLAEVAKLRALGEAMNLAMFAYLAHQSPSNMTKCYDAMSAWNVFTAKGAGFTPTTNTTEG